MINNLLPPGFKDVITYQSAIEHKYKNTIINLFQSYGYDLVKAPLIEYLDNNNHKNSFEIKTKKNDQRLIIRDDITMQIARIASNRLIKKIRPLKLCYYGEIVRVKGSMLRQEREFLQIGAECIGEKSYLADVEMISLAYNALSLVGIKNISIELSSKLFIEKLYKDIQSSPSLEKIKSLIGKKDIGNALKLINSKKHNYLKDIFSCFGNFKKKMKQLKKLAINKINQNEINNLINIYKNVHKNFPEIEFILDLTDKSKKNYHTGITFTIFAEGVRGEIARGGRYISINQNKKSEAGTGFTCYMDTILRASSIKEKFNKILIPFDTPHKKKDELISKNYIIETHFGQTSQIKEFAMKRGCNSYLSNNKIFNL